jgi:hypothetical protein
MTSKALANGAKGLVDAFVGKNVNKNGIYMTPERPRLVADRTYTRKAS